MELVVATRNAGKLKEIRRLLDEQGVRVLGIDEFPDLPEVEEDAESFAGNAQKKAETIACLTGRLTLADDSGLEVEALGGAPGVRSARFAGEGANDEANNRRLLEELRSVPAGKRRGAFVCVMALCTAQGECRFFEGRIEGEILAAPRGEGGFGYDPLFFLPQTGRTMAEIPLEEKNAISHRGQALRQVVDHLRCESALR